LTAAKFHAPCFGNGEISRQGTLGYKLQLEESS
jgi:hypothetical protein